MGMGWAVRTIAFRLLSIVIPEKAGIQWPEIGADGQGGCPSSLAGRASQKYGKLRFPLSRE